MGFKKITNEQEEDGLGPVGLEQNLVNYSCTCTKVYLQ